MTSSPTLLMQKCTDAAESSETQCLKIILVMRY